MLFSWKIFIEYGDETHGKRSYASKQAYLFVNAGQGQGCGSFTADVDLQLVPPELVFYNEYPGYSFTDLGRMDS